MSRMNLLFVPALVGGLLSLPACGKKADSPSDGKPAVKVYTTGWDAAKVAAAREKTQKDLKTILLGQMTALDFLSINPAGIVGPDSRNLGLSWRVAILPHIEVNKTKPYEALFKEFKLNEAWDSEHNKKLLAKMPDVYAPPDGKTADGLTFYRGFNGPDTVYEFNPITGQNPPPPGTFRQAKRFMFMLPRERPAGSLALVVEAGSSVPWTKPDELIVEAGKPFPALGGVFEDGFFALTGDWEVKFVKRGIDDENLQRFATISHNNPVTFP